MYDSPRDRRNGEDADAPKGYHVHARRAYRSPQLVAVGTLKNVQGFPRKRPRHHDRRLFHSPPSELIGGRALHPQKPAVTIPEQVLARDRRKCSTLLPPRTPVINIMLDSPFRFGQHPGPWTETSSGPAITGDREVSPLLHLDWPVILVCDLEIGRILDLNRGRFYCLDEIRKDLLTLALEAGASTAVQAVALEYGVEEATVAVDFRRLLGGPGSASLGRILQATVRVFARIPGDSRSSSGSPWPGF